MNTFVLQNLTPEHRSLRLAVVTETYPPEVNGVAMTLERMVRAMHARQHDIQLIRPRQGAADQACRTPGFEEVLKAGVPIPRYQGLKMGLPAKSALVRLWKVKRPDLVHVATEGPLGWSALHAALQLRIPVATDFHTNFHAYARHYGLGLLRTPVTAYLRKFHNTSLCTMVPTESLLRELQAHGYRNLIVVARGVDTDLFTPARRRAELRRAWGVAENDPVALYVGRLAPEKNLPRVVEAWQRMRAANPRVKLVLVGDGPERAGLETQHPEAVFAGMRTGEDLAAHYASADVFLFPSLTETYGNVTLEAMASGLAVVAYDYAAAREHIRPGVNGLLASFADPAAFGLLAESLASDPARIRALGGAALETARQVSWEHVFDRFERTLLNIVHYRERQDDPSAQLSFVPD